MQDWETDFKLFESGVKVIPANVKLRSNYGLELKEKGRVEEAKKQYKVCRHIATYIHTLKENYCLKYSVYII